MNYPGIAVINGAAVNIGATMTCAMDIRLASMQARVGFVVNKNVPQPGSVSSHRSPQG